MIKQFLKPTKRKLLLLIAMVLVTPFPITYNIYCDPLPCQGATSETEWLTGAKIIWDIIDALHPIGYAKLLIGYYLFNNWFFVFPILILDYLMVCMILYFIYTKRRSVGA